MSSRKIVGWLSEEDRQRYLACYARTMFVLSGNPAATEEDAQAAISEDQALYAELRKRYEIDEDDAVNFSLYDGAIMEAEEE